MLITVCAKSRSRNADLARPIGWHRSRNRGSRPPTRFAAEQWKCIMVLAKKDGCALRPPDKYRLAGAVRRRKLRKRRRSESRHEGRKNVTISEKLARAAKFQTTAKSRAGAGVRTPSHSFGGNTQKSCRSAISRLKIVTAGMEKKGRKWEVSNTPELPTSGIK